MSVFHLNLKPILVFAVWLIAVVCFGFCFFWSDGFSVSLVALSVETQSLSHDSFNVFSPPRPMAWQLAPRYDENHSSISLIFVPLDCLPGVGPREAAIFLISVAPLVGLLFIGSQTIEKCLHIGCSATNRILEMLLHCTLPSPTWLYTPSEGVLLLKVERVRVVFLRMISNKLDKFNHKNFQT